MSVEYAILNTSLTADLKEREEKTSEQKGKEIQIK